MKNKKKVRYRDLFFINLEKLSQETELGNIYRNLFLMIDEKQLEENIKYLHDLKSGKDSYFKEYGVTEWFGVWHKSIRQGDYFSGITQEKSVDLISDEERKEYKFLHHQVRQKDYNKRSNVPGQLFTDTYNRYLDLYNKVKREKISESVCGHLDMILWNTIHIDKENELYKVFLRTFSDFEIDEN